MRVSRPGWQLASAVVAALAITTCPELLSLAARYIALGRLRATQRRRQVNPELQPYRHRRAGSLHGFTEYATAPYH
jgi:hypothetical protein